MIYLRLIFEFFKTGLFTVGGGLATLPFLYEISNKTGWFSHTDIADMIAVSESTPGAIGINMSTYAGYTTGGVPGGILATLSLAAPSVIIILTDLFLWKAVLLGIAIFILQKFFPKLHPVIFIALSAAAGILFHFAGV